MVINEVERRGRVRYQKRFSMVVDSRISCPHQDLVIVKDNSKMESDESCCSVQHGFAVPDEGHGVVL